jgi:hypothetical protein
MSSCLPTLESSSRHRPQPEWEMSRRPIITPCRSTCEKWRACPHRVRIAKLLDGKALLRIRFESGDLLIGNLNV